MMDITLDRRHEFVYLEVTDGNTEMREDITNLKGFVRQDFIDNLRYIADELEAHNTERRKS
jgi:hypothetical protein